MTALEKLEFDKSLSYSIASSRKSTNRMKAVLTKMSKFDFAKVTSFIRENNNRMSTELNRAISNMKNIRCGVF
jgi:hypothetical protein